MERRRVVVYGGVCALSLAVLAAGYLAGGTAQDALSFVVVLGPLTAVLLDRWLQRRSRDRDR